MTHSAPRQVSAQPPSKTLRVSDNHRFLVCEDGSPFFYLADTAWELFHRPTLAEAEHYLTDRAAKRFTVIHAVVLAEFGCFTDPNANGDFALVNADPGQPNEAYFSHVDRVVDRAADMGLFIGMLPTWGDKWNRKWGAGPEIFTPENSRAYGRYLGRRYANKSIIWILGGDRPIETDLHRDIIRAMASGIQEGDGGRNLITFHPMGGQSSADSLHEEPWLDFNMVQSGHSRNAENHRAVTADYSRTPIKPCMDGEPGYEDHAAGFKIENGYLDEYDARKAAYWSLFAGSHGHTYGCHPVWQFLDAGRAAVTFARRPWYEAIHLPGAGQMQHARALLLSRPFLARIPDQSLIVSDPGAGVHHVRATRDLDGSYALIYVPTPQKLTLDPGKLSGPTLSAHWYDPRTGASRLEGLVPAAGPVEFTTPQGGPDWVLVLDNPERGYPPPGMAIWPGRAVTPGHPPE